MLEPFARTLRPASNLKPHPGVLLPLALFSRICLGAPLNENCPGLGEGGLNEGQGQRCSFLGPHRATHGTSQNQHSAGSGWSGRGSWASPHAPELLSPHGMAVDVFQSGDGEHRQLMF